MIKCVANNDIQSAKKYALACCQQETDKRAKILLAPYQNILNADSRTVQLPKKLEAFASMEDLTHSYNVNRYYISEREKELYERIRKMHKVSIKLMEKQIPYLNATLLYGESGVGKTAFSRYVAYKLGMPYLYINFSRMIDRYLGGTAENMGNLFSFIAANKCLVMLDEIDCIASSRNYDQGTSAELARSTTSLIQLLDTISNNHIIIAATNLYDEIDAAIKRRFTEKYRMERLCKKDKLDFIQQYFSDIGMEYDLESAMRYTENDVSQAELVTHMIQAIADAMINNKKITVL